MGNNGSSSHHQHSAPNGLSAGMGRGWTHSFPRELARHHSQPAGRKVLPEPPNQRLRATNNGSIIHKGGTISGRRPPALTLPHDLNKQGVFRSRSTSASNIGEPRSRKTERHCCHYQSDSSHLENEALDLKRFGSEPDLRYSPESRLPERCSGKSNGREDGRSSSGYHAERESRESRENRYKGRKKYKAPAPPPVNGHGDGSSPESCKWNVNRDGESRCRPEDDVHPPPRRSRLFKTRAETKKAQVNWHFPASLPSYREREDKDRIDGDSRWKGERGCGENERPATVASVVPNGGWHDRDPRDRCRRQNDQKRSKHFDGKNTLQRSMSSPEFQAELIQVARKVRDKLNCSGRMSAASPVAETTGKFRSLDRPSEDPDIRVGKADERIEDKLLLDRCRRRENPAISLKDRRKVDHPRDSNRERNWKDEQPGITSDGKNIVPERSMNLEDGRTSSVDRDVVRKPLRERLEVLAYRSKTEYSMDHRKTNESAKNGSEPGSPEDRFVRGKFDPRGWPSGRASTSERIENKGGDKENSDPKRWKSDSRSNHSKPVVEKKWVDPVGSEKIESKVKGNFPGETKGTRERRPDIDWQALASPEKTTPKTFYFGMNEPVSNESHIRVDEQVEQIQPKVPRDMEDVTLPVCTIDDTDEGKNVIEDISLKLRPTLPKKQLEIPRFSPSVAWRLLSALEAPAPTMSTASEEIPVMFEERIERLSRPPPPLVALGPRSLHDKSGDSGISGDAGAPNEDSLDVSTTNRIKTPATRPTWTPQQDLGEESSSDAGVDSPPPMPTPIKYPPRAHVFSLSLPRDDNRTYLYNTEAKSKDVSAFNSLQKLKRSVSGALGLGVIDLERKDTRDILDDNWLLSTSAPTSLQHNQVPDVTRTSPPGWRPSFEDEDDENDEEDEEDEDEDDEGAGDVDVDGHEADEEDLEGRNDFPVIMKPPSFSYLASGGHVMYLPESNDAEYRAQSLNGRQIAPTVNEKATIYKKNSTNEFGKATKTRPACANGSEKTCKRSKDSRLYSGELNSKAASNKFAMFSKSCENISEMKQRSDSPTSEREILPRNSSRIKEAPSEAKEVKGQPKNNSKGRRFTFQSTVRQIERRRLAEKLSREAEAKERQRKGELEAMRKVEEEFQRKRAREKANIRQQLRLYNMEENLNSLPTGWDGSQLSRADPDGAASSTASSPTSIPTSVPAKLPPMARKSSVSSDEFHRKKGSGSHAKHLQHREHQNYRPKYYDWAPDSAPSHLDYKQTTVHPKVVCDIPKSSPAFVDSNVHPGKTGNSNTTPRSDNYRKDFAHGAVAARSSLASSDSELSQPNTRPHSRQTGNKITPVRSRSASPGRSEDPGSSEEESPSEVDPVKPQQNPTSDFVLNGVQPFVREKTYRPISFNPQPPPPIPS